MSFGFRYLVRRHFDLHLHSQVFLIVTLEGPERCFRFLGRFYLQNIYPGARTAVVLWLFHLRVILSPLALRNENETDIHIHVRVGGFAAIKAGSIRATWLMKYVGYHWDGGRFRRNLNRKSLTSFFWYTSDLLPYFRSHQHKCSSSSYYWHSHMLSKLRCESNSQSFLEYTCSTTGYANLAHTFSSFTASKLPSRNWLIKLRGYSVLLLDSGLEWLHSNRFVYNRCSGVAEYAQQK